MNITGFALAVVLAMVPVPQGDEAPKAPPSRLASAAGRQLLDSLGIPEHSSERLNAVVNELLPLRDRRLIPLRQEGYEKAPSYVEKLMFAAQLVFLGAEDPQYWNYLYREAKAAVESGMPARAEMAGLSEEHPELKAWREQGGLTGKQAEELLSRQLITMIAIGSAADQRAFDLLVDCLFAPNQFLFLPCMKGLARLQDKRAIEPMISALGRLDNDTADGGVRYLLHFDDPRAQEAAKRFAKDKEHFELWRKTVAEEGVTGLYGY